MNKPTVKNMILIGIPTIISGIGIIMTLDFLSNYKNIFIFVTILLLITFVCCVVYYGKIEKNGMDKAISLENDITKLKTTITSMGKLLNTNNSIVTSVVSIIEPWTTNINKIANDIRSRGKANEKDWDYEKICTDICVGCRDMIKQFTDKTNDTEILVGFIKYSIEDDKEYVRMISHSSPPTAKPDIYDVTELLVDCHYQYAKLIKGKTRDILALENNDKIKNHFHRKHDDRTDLSKYTQYIAIPILCSRNKTLGVLQVTTKYGCKIMETDVDLKKFAEMYITPFVELLVLVEKIQKGLFIKPNK